ncbi:MAG: hypothetical protein WKF97_15445 [Chitinophagaceae bacterium]
MSDNTTHRVASSETEIDFKNIQDIIYWSKKWEVSPHQLMKAFTETQSSNVNRIIEYLREQGFAL